MLKPYRKKRNFRKTPEPEGKRAKSGRGELKFFIQLHRASRLHYDFRLELDGVLKSWAVPKGPSMNPLDRRLAVHVEDHPLDYGPFEGTIPKGNYGAGTVLQWDRGTYAERFSVNRRQSEAAIRRGIDQGKFTFVLSGEKLKGEFALIKLKGKSENAWLLIKKPDGFARYQNETGAAGTAKKIKVNKSEPSLRAQVRTGKKSPMPRVIKPMLFVQTPAPVGPRWQLLVAGDGVRVIAEIKNGRPRLTSRHQLPLDKKYPTLLKALRNVDEDLILDGEIIENPKPTLRVFDLLYHRGNDLRDLSLRARWQRLLKKQFPPEIVLAKTARNEENRIARDLTTIYRAGIHSAWRKINRESANDTERDPIFSHVDKIYFPKDEITKGELIEYYRRVAPFILPHLKDRPLSLNRHPHGITGQSFYQKDFTGYHPKWLETFGVESTSAGKTINYVLCQNSHSLLYLVNLGCIEFNPWLSRIAHLDRPDYCVIDLDPDDKNTFSQVVEVALAFHSLFSKLKLPHFVKTSGATGLHIVVPLRNNYEFLTVRQFAEKVCRRVQERFKSFTSVDRTPARRRGKIYVDFLQNRRGQTLAAPYCVRPHDGAPVSTPLEWREVNNSLNPRDFNVNSILLRLRSHGDLWLNVLTSKPANLKKATTRLLADDFTF